MIENGKVVTLGYELKNATGEVMDRADAKDPFLYIHGAGQIVPGLENALAGMKIGEKKAVVVAPAEGYGERKEALRLVVKRAQFPGNVEIAVGMQFQAQGPDGSGVIFTVEKLEGDSVHIDGNHPMAGQPLHFNVEVLSVRAATAEEMAHGHAHGPGGHHH